MNQQQQKHESVTNTNGSIIKIHHEDYPPGYRFCPYDEELVVHYLRKKVTHQNLSFNHIHELNLYCYNPDDLAGITQPALGTKEWYFFTPRDRRCQNGKRPKRTTRDGFWKASAGDKAVKYNGHTVGYKKILVFYKGKPPGNKTNWIMQEFTLPNSSPRNRNGPNDMRLDDWVLCKVYMHEGGSKNRQQGEECVEVGSPSPSAPADQSTPQTRMKCIESSVGFAPLQADPIDVWPPDHIRPTVEKMPMYIPQCHVQPNNTSTFTPLHDHPTLENMLMSEVSDSTAHYLHPKDIFFDLDLSGFPDMDDNVFNDAFWHF